MASKSIKDKVVIITGATSGIGEATAKLLASEGAIAVLAGRRQDRLDQLLASIEKAGGRAFAHQTDVTSYESVKNLVDTVVKKYDRIDILFNNAGVMLLGPVIDADTTDWQRMIDTNLYGLIWCTHAVLPYMVRQGSGHIVQTSSVAGRTANSGSAVYNLTKWGVNAFTEGLRQELVEHKIRTTLVEPGMVATELRDHITHAESKKNANQWADSMRQLQSEDIAEAVRYAVTRPDHVDVNEMLIRPTDQQR
ncbi:MAG TPA: SDR family NAD(P)-dependent oxidoreductase [Candidatus Saccharimonadia bacterium]|nr:SDR family NAD(P)-dependent oxidoreductase [Candidatus Saccharimonadia bacterium]